MQLSRLFERRPVEPTTRPEREQLVASLLVMAWVVEARDPYTGGHLWRVSRYAALLCERAGLPAGERARITIGAFLHDLGKIGVPDAILRKPAALSEAEYAVMKTHPDVGHRLLAGHPLRELVSDAVLMHHERPDGTGYPLGLREDALPLAARIVGVCDAFDAMTSARPYRKAMAVRHALEIIEAGRGRQFDATLGDDFLALGAEGALDHIAGHSDDGIPLQSCVVCGPTLVVRRELQAGDLLYCPSCGGGYRLEPSREEGGLRAVPASAVAAPADIEPAADLDLIERLVSNTAHDAISAGALPGATVEGGSNHRPEPIGARTS